MWELRLGSSWSPVTYLGRLASVGWEYVKVSFQIQERREKTLGSNG